MSKEDIAQARPLFGPAPILTREEADRFEEYFAKLAIGLKAQDFVELLLIWHFTCESWSLNRYTRHAAVAIERRYQEGVRTKLQHDRLQHAHKQQAINADIRSGRPADIAAVAVLEEKVLSSADDVDDILKRKETERGLNIAFERGMLFQDQLDKLTNGATRRRDDTLAQLETYRAGLGAQAKEAAERILDGEYQEVIPISTDAPALLPPGQGTTTDDAQSPPTLVREE